MGMSCFYMWKFHLLVQFDKYVAENYWFQVVFYKVRVINLTQGGLRAICDLEQLERERGNGEYIEAEIEPGSEQSHVSGARTASDEMCTFLVMNISSLQLIPVIIIAYRSQYGSANPAGVIAPAIVATAVSTGVAVVYCKVMGKGQRV